MVSKAVNLSDNKLLYPKSEEINISYYVPNLPTRKKKTKIKPNRRRLLLDGTYSTWNQAMVFQTYSSNLNLIMQEMAMKTNRRGGYLIGILDSGMAGISCRDDTLRNIVLYHHLQ